MSKRRSRKKPEVRETRELPDGTKEITDLTWEEAFGDKPPQLQVMFEHNYLHNEVFRHESDRAVGVLAPAYLDALLEDLLRDFFIEGKSADVLLRPDGPLGTFSSKIDAAHALGFINDDTQRDLNLIRKIRNDFAHQVDLHSFEDDPIKNRCAELGTPKQWNILDPPKPGQPAIYSCLRYR